MEITKESLANKWGEFCDLAEFSSQRLQDGRFSVAVENAQFECLFQHGTEQRLFVLLSGARNPAVQPIIKFDRWTWRGLFPGAVLYISDPTLLLDPEELHIGWYVGTAEHDWKLAMAALVSNVAERLGIPTRSVICYGSSAGGFGAMTLAAALGDATAVAINPQTDVTKYSKRFVKHFCEVAFGVQSPELLSPQDRIRLSAIESIKNASAVKCLIAQNISDPVHYRDHYTPFCNQFDVPLSGGQNTSGRIRSLLFDCASGHGPEPKELAPELIAEGIKLSDGEPEENIEPAPQVIAVSSILQRPRIEARQLYLLGAKGVPSQKIVDKRYSFTAPGRKDLPPYQLEFPIDWNSDPYKDRNWCAQLHMWRMIDGHLIQHSRTLDSDWLQFPLAVITDWYRHMYIEKRAAEYAWMDMMVGLRSMKLAYVISQLVHDNGMLEPELHEMFDVLIRDHIGFLIDHRNVAYSNHTFIDVHGVAALAQLVGAADAAEIDAFIDDVLGKLLASQFDKYGVHRENSPGYHPFGIACVRRLQDSQWFGRFNLGALIHKAEEVSNWFLMPDGRTIPFGDTDGQRQDPAIETTVFQGRRQVFNSSGYAVVRNDGNGKVKESSLLAVMGAFNSRFHKQADDLSFVWFEGEDILCDAGKFAYKADRRRGYVQSTRAHNTVEIDNDNYGGDWIEHPELIYGSAIGAVSVSEWGYMIDAQVRHHKFGVQHSRFFAYSPNEWVLVIDRLMADRAHDFTQWFHFSPHLPDMARELNGYVTQLSNGRKLRVHSIGNGQVSDLMEKGVTSPRIQGWISQSYGELVPNCALGYRQRGQDVLFATLLSLDDSGSKLTLQEGNKLSLKLSRNGERDAFRFVVGEHSCRVRRL